MSMSNCPRCGKVFSDTSGRICSDCKKEEEAIYDEVRDYVKDHRDATLAEVVSNTKATPKRIMRYIREGRLEVSTGMRSDIDLRCEKCKKPIVSGKFCDSCVISINQTVNDMFAPKQEKDVAKMHIRGSQRK